MRTVLKPEKVQPEGIGATKETLALLPLISDLLPMLQVFGCLSLPSLQPELAVRLSTCHFISLLIP